MSDNLKLSANSAVPSGEIRSPATWLKSKKLKDGGFVGIKRGTDTNHLKLIANTAKLAKDHLVSPGDFNLSHGEEIPSHAYEIFPVTARKYRAAKAFGTPQGRAELLALTSGVLAGLIFASLRLGAAGYTLIVVNETVIFWLYIIVGILGAISPIASYRAGKWLSR